MIRLGHLERISKYSRRIIIIVTGGIPVPPCGEGFPAKRHNNLFSPFGSFRRKPLFLDAPPFAVKAKLPRAIQVQPIVSLDRSTLPIRPWILGSRKKKLARRE